MTARRRRTLTGDEQALWAQATRDVTRTAPAPAVPVQSEEHAVAAAGTDAAARAPSGEQPVKENGAPTPPKADAPRPPRVPGLVPLERRLRRRLSRGSHPIDATIDLHGLRQAEAHIALRAFLYQAQSDGHTIVLVVTGKGEAAVAGRLPFEERGVLRRIVPHWLRQADLRDIVVGFEQAVAHHGGGGALYVRLRRAGRAR